jgi:CDP-glucose 4,6-dehydratase
LAARERFGEVCGGFNFGPNPRANRTVKELVEEMLKWEKGSWVDKSDPHAVHEAGLLNLSIAKARRILGWKPRWGFAETVKQTVAWYSAVAKGADPIEMTKEQISEYGF